LSSTQTKRNKTVTIEGNTSGEGGTIKGRIGGCGVPLSGLGTKRPKPAKRAGKPSEGKTKAKGEESVGREKKPGGGEEFSRTGESINLTETDKGKKHRTHHNKREGVAQEGNVAEISEQDGTKKIPTRIEGGGQERGLCGPNGAA